MSLHTFIAGIYIALMPKKHPENPEQKEKYLFRN